jgi:hypothetical protein
MGLVLDIPILVVRLVGGNSWLLSGQGVETQCVCPRMVYVQTSARLL